MLTQLVTIVLWTALEYLLLRALQHVFPSTFTALLAKLFPPT